MINKFKFILNNYWDIDTCYPSSRNIWSEKNKCVGQCAITSVIVNEYFSGIIRKCQVGNASHYFNFINYDKQIEKSREQILGNEDTKRRYNILKQKVLKYMKKLDSIDNEIKRCFRCNDKVEKFTNNNTISFGKVNKILILGEAPANNGWRKSGVAWYDINKRLLPSGKVLQQLLDIINVKLEDTLSLEVIKCYPRDRKYLNECNKNCQKFLESQLSILKPDLILLLGDSASKATLNIKYKKYSEIVGRCFYKNISGKEIILMPIYHPSPTSPKSYLGNIEIFKKLKEVGVY